VARAGQGVDAAADGARLGAALAASLAAHGAVLGALGALPGAWPALPIPLAPVLHATLALPAALPPAAPAASRARLPLPRYYSAAELDQRPLIESHVEPQFPALALAPTGRVVLRLYVDESGRVERIAVESGDPTGAFEQAARAAFGDARFRPGIKAGVPVKSLLRIEVRFGSPHPDNS
jgi:protein TonB